LRDARESALKIVRSERFMSLVESYQLLAPEDAEKADGQARLATYSSMADEIKGMKRANEGVHDAGLTGKARRWLSKRVPGCLSASSTTVGSLKDMLEIWNDEVDPYVKSGLTLLKEGIEMYKDLRSNK